MLAFRRPNDNIARPHLVGPMRDAVSAIGQHANRYPILAHHAPRTHAERKRAKVKLQTADQNVGEPAMQVTAIDLSNFGSGGLNDALEFLEALYIASLHRKRRAHRSSTRVLKGHYGASTKAHLLPHNSEKIWACLSGKTAGAHSRELLPHSLAQIVHHIRQKSCLDRVNLRLIH
jgi:hypothetical protein